MSIDASEAAGVVAARHALNGGSIRATVDQTLPGGWTFEDIRIWASAAAEMCLEGPHRDARVARIVGAIASAMVVAAEAERIAHRDEEEDDAE